MVKLRVRLAVRHPLGPDQIADQADGTTDVQTFYLAQSGPNLVFHADNAERVYIQSRYLFLTGDGTIVSADVDGGGHHLHGGLRRQHGHAPRSSAQSTVRSRRDRPPTAQVRTRQVRYLQLPHPYPQGGRPRPPDHRAVSARPGDADPHTYDKVEAIEGWMSTHVQYTTDIPPLAPGADAVTSFLFGTRRGYCEQISTATVVMLRSLGIPARETVGYVPGSYNPITDLYDVQAKDAHAWVQVWFPGYGWQNFDPTADVPLANPSPGSVLARSAGHASARLPWVPIAVVAAVAAIGRRSSVGAGCGARPPGPTRWPPTSSAAGRRLRPAPRGSTRPCPPMGGTAGGKQIRPMATG